MDCLMTHGPGLHPGYGLFTGMASS